MTTTLYTFHISHFSEKARWGLALAGVPFSERALLPGLHMARLRRIAPRTTVPVLVRGATVIQGSSAILDHAASALGRAALEPPPAAAAEARELEALADRAFGLGVQRIFYDALLHDRGTLVDLWAQAGPWWSKGFYRVAFPAMALGLRKTYKLRPDVVAAARDRFIDAWRRLDAIVAARPYVVGDRPSRVDVTIAALLGPVVRPAEHSVRWPAPPEATRSFVAELEGTPTWAYVERMYRDHRHAPALG
ncbi:MAG: glutathione S-transferase [Myxococcales bacterium]|nr:glutathione S-transferase [Myxococcales bacterium]